MIQNDKDFVNQVARTIASIRNLNSSIHTLEVKDEIFGRNPTNNSAELILDLDSKITECYQSTIKLVENLIHQIDAKAAQMSQEDIVHQEITLPSPENVKSNLKRFFRSRNKTKIRPLPLYTGCYAHRNKAPQPGQYVCAKYHDAFILAAVAAFDGTTLTAYDPNDVDKGIQLITLPNDDWTPLPTIIPDRPLGRWEHTKDSHVLALYPNETDKSLWSTIFYKATVVLRPCDRQATNPDERGYTLDFGDDQSGRQIIEPVPEQFVAILPENWASTCASKPQ